MGLRLTQGDEKRLLLLQLPSLEALRSPLSSRPKRSVAERSLCGCTFLEMFFDRRSHGPQGPPKLKKNGTYSATALPGSAIPPLVIPTEAQRSGGTRGSAALSWICFSREESWALGPTQGDEKRLLFSNYSLWKRLSPICHLDRSAAKWRDLRSRSFLGNVFRESVVERPAVSLPRPRNRSE
jgi:hypothetical protein